MELDRETKRFIVLWYKIVKLFFKSESYDWHDILWIM